MIILCVSLVTVALAMNAVLYFMLMRRFANLLQAGANAIKTAEDQVRLPLVRRRSYSWPQIPKDHLALPAR